MTAHVVKIRQPALSDPEWSDDAVAAACSSRDPVAVAELFDRFQPLVTRYLSRIVGVNGEVEDLVQSTFLEVASGRARFERRSTVSTWLLGIATNVARHHMRSRTRRRRLLAAIRDMWSPEPPSPSRVVSARRDLAAVEAVLAAQTEERRIAFVLCEIEGVSARSAADILSTSEAAVWKRVSDVRRALRAIREEP